MPASSSRHTTAKSPSASPPHKRNHQSRSFLQPHSPLKSHLRHLFDLRSLFHFFPPTCQSGLVRGGKHTLLFDFFSADKNLGASSHFQLLSLHDLFSFETIAMISHTGIHSLSFLVSVFLDKRSHSHLPVPSTNRPLARQFRLCCRWLHTHPRHLRLAMKRNRQPESPRLPSSKHLRITFLRPLQIPKVFHVLVASSSSPSSRSVV